MRLPFTLIFALLGCDAVFASPAKRHYSTHNYYVLEHDPSAGASLADVARTLGVEVIEQAGELHNHWLVRASKPTSALDSRQLDPVMQIWEGLQAGTVHNSYARADETLLSRHVASSVKYLSPQTLRQRVKRAPPPINPGSQTDEQVESSKAFAQRMGILDPDFPRQWHLINDQFPHHMMNVTGLWEMGHTGEGVITAFVDDGLDYTSDDLAANFYAAGSYDFNDHLDLPTPTLFDDHHGTRCAGQVAAVKNELCGVGIAYDSKVAGLRILSGPISDVDESAALNYDYQNTSIYSCSWGPPDDGKSMEGPGYMIRKAIVNGIQKGRQGKGSVFVFASGNGGRSADQCNFDGYTNSIFSITVAAIDFRGLHPTYSEACAANMVVAYSSGGGNAIATTDRGKNKCSYSHGGTSAAAPNAAGVFALALGVRPDLTWRDLQHLCVRTATKVNPDDPDWEITASGNQFSYKYGYGAVNGYKFVQAAKTWQLVKPQTFINLPVVQVENGTMDLFHQTTGGTIIAPGGVSSSMTLSQSLLDENNFGALEHITIQVWITHTRRGDVEVELVSPNGVKSILAAKRFADKATTGFRGWTFMTVKHWDESPVGTWNIRVSDQDNEGEIGRFLGWTMTIWGSAKDASKPVKIYDVPTVDTVLPPPHPEANIPASTIVAVPTSTKTYAKPTAHLPGDHSDSEGEAHKPAFPVGPQNGTRPGTDTADPSQSSAVVTNTPTPDEGWFAELSNLVTNQIWFFVAVGAVILFGVIAGLFFWRRAARRKAAYTSLPESDEVVLSSVDKGAGVGQRSKELYDAFGEVSDDEEADEETRLRPAGVSPAVNLHAGFLDDDPSTAGGITPRYRDEPEEGMHAHERERSDSPTSGSGDGSWEHASETR
ncbi:uncharacterized protein FIBRA_02020 [Fibroporia radiculosa]|uniref:P/Homo B domain-containing protein n=1 Tax=Fibroporia radiculosa TaxID=599839 RepID=J4GM50_9APHY|nr:uncharacterized protein FIBRA_02020 [Fibroporia radiculosa]CCL99995.1 predicted protein [Fibroporia radiculosa]